MPQHKSSDYKLSAVKYFLTNDASQLKVCRIFECSPRSLMRWVNKYEKHKNIKRDEKVPIAYKVKQMHVKFILNELNKNKTITTNDLLINLQKKFPNLSLSQVHVSRIIKDNNISLKNTKLRHVPITRFGKSIDVNQMLKTFYEKVNRYNLNDIICIDETSINALQVRKQCYSKVGKKCVIQTDSQEVFKKYTAIFAISTYGVIGFELYEKGGIDSQRLTTFINKYLSKYKNKLIVLDNASSHRNENVKQLISKHNELLHSVPYQHFTNTIEQFFSVLKSKLHKMSGMSHSKLKRNIGEAIKLIPLEYYRKIFNGSYKRKNYNNLERKHRKIRHKNYL